MYHRSESYCWRGRGVHVIDLVARVGVNRYVQGEPVVFNIQPRCGVGPCNYTCRRVREEGGGEERGGGVRGAGRDEGKRGGEKERCDLTHVNVQCIYIHAQTIYSIYMYMYSVCGTEGSVQYLGTVGCPLQVAGCH